MFVDAYLGVAIQDIVGVPEGVDPQDVPQASQPTAVILKVTRHQFISCFWMQFRMFQVLSPYFTAPPKAVGSNSPAKNVVKRHDFENVQHVVDIVAHELARSARYERCAENDLLQRLH